MGVKRIKVTKKNAAKTEEVITLTQRSMALAEDHPFWAVGVVAGLILVLGLVWGFYSYGVAKDQRARADYAKVLQNWPKKEIANTKDWEKFAADLQNYIKQHRGTQPGLNAQLDLAQAYFWMHRYQDAVNLDEKLLKKVSSADDLQPLVRYHLALTYQEMGQTEAAMKQWQVLETEAVPGLQREINWHLANLYAKQKDYVKAVAYYEKALKTASGYPNEPLIQQQLASMKLKTGTAAANPKVKVSKGESKG